MRCETLLPHYKIGDFPQQGAKPCHNQGIFVVYFKYLVPARNTDAKEVN